MDIFQDIQNKKIIIDGIIFKIKDNSFKDLVYGWKHILHFLSKSSISKNILLLDRENTVPDFLNFKRIIINGAQDIISDSKYIQNICDNHNCLIFISTLNTYAEKTPSIIFLSNRLLKNALEQNLKYSIQKAIGYIFSSDLSKNHFFSLYPTLSNRPTFIIKGGVSKLYEDNSSEVLHNKYEVLPPFFIFVHNVADNRKNKIFFNALNFLENKKRYKVVVLTYLLNEAENEISNLTKDYQNFYILNPFYKGMEKFYKRAIALVFLNNYEDFYFPLYDAIRYGCPIIAIYSPILYEILGDGVYYVAEDDIYGLRDALISIQNSTVRKIFKERLNKKINNNLWDQYIEKLVNFIQKSIEFSNSYKRCISLNKKGEKYFSQSNIDEALRLFNKIKDEYEFFPEVYNNLGVIYFNKGMIVKSLENLLKALKLDQYDKDTIQNCKEILNILSQQREIISQKSEYPKVMILESELRFFLGDLKGAKRILEEVLKKSSDFADAYNNLGVILWKEGDKKGAIECLKKAMEIDPDHKEAPVNYEMIKKEIRNHCL